MFLPGWWRNPKNCRVARLRLFAGRGPMMAWRFPTSHSGNWHFFSLGGILRSHGTVENTIQTFLTRTGVNVRPITAEVAALATQFPESYPRDPVDNFPETESPEDRKSTRLNSSHVAISYAVFCLKKKR